jgi:membrane protease subunit HflK
MSEIRPFPNAPQIRINPQVILGGFGALFLLIGVVSGVYQVPAESVAVVQRFGGYLKTETPGLHFKLPWGIDQITLVEILRQQKLEFGFGTRGASNPYQYADANDQEEEKTMVTGDLNTALVEWVVQYHISDPVAYVFNFREPVPTLRDLSQAVMREVVGDRTVDEVLTIGRQEMETKCAERLRELVAALDMGVRIDQIQLGNINPPSDVQASFSDVNRAKQEKESAINAASGNYYQIIPKARGEAEQKVKGAEGYTAKRVNEAEGDAARFKSVLAEYLKAPEVTKKRLYLETMGEVLSQVPGKIILDEKASSFLPLMNLRQAEPQTTPAPATR